LGLCLSVAVTALLGGATAQPAALAPGLPPATSAESALLARIEGPYDPQRAVPLPGLGAPALPRAQTGDPVIATAGDIACDPAAPSFNGGVGTATECRMAATSDLLLGVGLVAVLPLGDTQYERGALGAFQQSYAPSWGRVKSISRPAVGNHEYQTADAVDYFTYFGAAAGDPARGYYSFDVGAWHLIALNANCPHVGGCGTGLAQEQWLRADLAAHPAACTLAYWHQPRFSSGLHGNDATYTAFWQALYDYRADVVLNGHDHLYERFALQDPNGVATSAGIRQFTVGTGGRSHYAVTTVQPNSEVRNTDTFGVLLLTLRAGGYDWRFRPEAGKTFTDSGTETCHRGTAISTPTATPTRIPGDITGDGFVDIQDYGRWRLGFGATDCGNAADLNGDCTVDIRDYGFWRQHFGETAGSAARGAAPAPAAGPPTATGTPTAGPPSPPTPTGRANAAGIATATPSSTRTTFPLAAAATPSGAP
jgi:acid phosphatase type 7